MKEVVHDDFVVVGGQDSPHLTATPVALLGKVAFGSTGCLRAAGHPGHIAVQEQPALRKVMPGHLTMTTQDHSDGLLQLGDILCRRAIQGLLDNRLLSTGTATKGALYDGVTAQAGVDLDQTLGASQERNEGIEELLAG